MTWLHAERAKETKGLACLVPHGAALLSQPPSKKAANTTVLTNTTGNKTWSMHTSQKRPSRSLTEIPVKDKANQINFGAIQSPQYQHFQPAPKQRTRKDH